MNFKDSSESLIKNWMLKIKRRTKKMVVKLKKGVDEFENY